MLADLGLTVDALDPAAADRLLDPRADGREGRARLAHPLIGDAIVAAAGRPAVRAMHARAADAAEALGLPPSVVIAHLVAAAQPGDGAVTDRLLAQAERAEAAGLGDAAAHALLAAAELALTAPERCRLAARAARTLIEVGTADTTDVAPILALADPSVLGPEERFWVEWLRAEHLAGDLERSQLAAERVLELAAELDSPMLAWIRFSALNNAWAMLDAESTLRHAAAMLALADRPDADAAARMPAWACRGMHALALFQVGQVRAAAAELDAIREVSRCWRPTPDRDLVERLQVAVADAYLVQLDPWVDARYEELAGLLDADPGQTLGAVRIMQAERACRRGQFRRARALLDESRALGFGAGSRTVLDVLAAGLPAGRGGLRGCRTGGPRGRRAGCHRRTHRMAAGGDDREPGAGRARPGRGPARRRAGPPRAPGRGAPAGTGAVGRRAAGPSRPGRGPEPLG